MARNFISRLSCKGFDINTSKYLFYNRVVSVLYHTPVYLLFFVGCGLFDCDEQTEVVEVAPGSPFYSVEVEFLEEYRRRGFKCEGRAINTVWGPGNEYTCTKCD